MKKKITRAVEQTGDLQKVDSSRADGDARREAGSPRGAAGKLKRCFFCQSKTSPSYTDISVLRRFTTDRVKIVPRVKNNLCSKHQRAITKQIKYARHLSLLPFTPKV